MAGGTLTGALTLAADPTRPCRPRPSITWILPVAAATGVINVRSAPYNAQLNGVTDDTAAFKAAYQALPAGSVIYVPNGVTVLQNPVQLGYPADQAGQVDRRRHFTARRHAARECNSRWRRPSKQLFAWDRRRQQRNQRRGLAERFPAHRFRGGPFVLHRKPQRWTTGGAVIANTRNDTIIYNSPEQFRLGRHRQIAMVRHANSERHSCRRARRALRPDDQAKCRHWIRPARPLPQPNLWAACLEYRDTTGLPSSMAASSITVEMDWFGNGPDDGDQRQIQSLVIAQHNTSGPPVEVSIDHRRLSGRQDAPAMPTGSSTSMCHSRHRCSTPPIPTDGGSGGDPDGRRARDRL